MKPITLTAVLTVALFSTGAHAALVHRYSFAGDASDSISGADGILVDAGVVANGSFADGRLDLSTNAPEQINIVEGAFVDLPNGIVTNAYKNGVPGKMTIEMWAHSHVNATWAALFSAGGTTHIQNDEGVPQGIEADYIQFIPQAFDYDDGALRVTASRRFSFGPAGEDYIDRSGPLSTTAPTHIVAVFDTALYRQVPRVLYRGNLIVYVDGSLIGSVALDLNFQMVDMVDENIWIGRSQHRSDPLFRGWIDELRIYDSALTAADAARNHTLGPDAIPEPAAARLLAMAGLSVLGVARRRLTS